MAGLCIRSTLVVNGLKENLIFKCLIPFHATGLFLYPLNTSENQRFSDVFWGIERHQWHEIGKNDKFF